jgi:hypothetical protein
MPHKKLTVGVFEILNGCVIFQLLFVFKSVYEVGALINAISVGGIHIYFQGAYIVVYGGLK